MSTNKITVAVNAGLVEEVERLSAELAATNADYKAAKKLATSLDRELAACREDADKEQTSHNKRHLPD